VGVLELEQLHGPLDVGEPPSTQLEVRMGVGAARQPLGLDPRLERADLAHLRRGEPLLAVAQRVDESGEVAGERLRAGDRRSA
jgi:hypothetical protein